MRKRNFRFFILSNTDSKSIELIANGISGRDLRFFKKNFFNTSALSKIYCYRERIGLTFYTQQNIDAKAFAETLQKLVPVVEKYIQ